MLNFMYRYLINLIIATTILLQQTDQQPSVNINVGLVELAIGFIVGLSPTIFGAIKDKVKWKDEKKVVQSEAVENIAQAASILAEQSQNLTSKNATLIQLYENALQRQTEMAEKERGLRLAQDEEIENLKQQIDRINKVLVTCSKEILGLIRDISQGNEITHERLAKLEEVWAEDKDLL